MTFSHEQQQHPPSVTVAVVTHDKSTITLNARAEFLSLLACLATSFFLPPFQPPVTPLMRVSADWSCSELRQELLCPCSSGLLEHIKRPYRHLTVQLNHKTRRTGHISIQSIHPLVKYPSNSQEENTFRQHEWYGCKMDSDKYIGGREKQNKDKTLQS